MRCDHHFLPFLINGNEITYLNRPNAPNGADSLTFRQKEQMTISLQFVGQDQYHISYDFHYAPDNDPAPARQK